MHKLVLDLGKFISSKSTELVGRKNGQVVAEKIAKAGINFDDYDKIVIEMPSSIVIADQAFFLRVWEDKVINLGAQVITFKREPRRTGWPMVYTQV